MKKDIGNIAVRIVNFIKDILTESGKDKLILGLSGGIDSSVTYMLSVAAVGRDNVLAYALPYNYVGQPKSVQMASDLTKYVSRTLADIIDIKFPVDSFYSDSEKPGSYRLGNIMARVRMTYLYDKAMDNNGLVLNTCNLSEDLVGYATKYGDAAGDLAPIAHLTKTEVYELAEYLQIPENLINRVPSAELWENQTDEQELGFTYKELDSVIDLYREKKVFLDKPLYYNMYFWMDYWDNFNHDIPVSYEVWELIRNKNFNNQHKLRDMPNLWKQR